MTGCTMYILELYRQSPVHWTPMIHWTFGRSHNFPIPLLATSSKVCSDELMEKFILQIYLEITVVRNFYSSS